MNKYIIWKKGVMITALAVVGILWTGGREADVSAAEVSATEVSVADNSVEPALAGQQSVLYINGGDAVTVTGDQIETVVFSSDNPDIAAVSQAGVVTGVSEGTAHIQAEVTYGRGESYTKKLSYEVEVKDDYANYFQIEDGTVSGLTQKGKSMKDMVIPDYYRGVRVTDADWGKFLPGNQSVERIFLSDFMEHFGGDFKPDDRMPAGIRELYFGKDFRYYAYIDQCTELEKISLHSMNINFYVKDNVLFSKNQDDVVLEFYPAGRKDSSYKVPDDVTTIYFRAFYGVEALTEVILPKGLGWIRGNAFENTGLTEVSIPAGTKLGNNVFAGCKKLQKVLLPKRYDQYESAFYNCPALKTVVVPNTAKRISAEGFKNCPNLEEFLVSAGESDFYAKDGVLFKWSDRSLVAYPVGKKESSYTVPENIEEISEGAFCDAASLSEIILDDALRTIDYRAFLGCSSLRKIRIPRQVKNINSSWSGRSAGLFPGCSSLEEISVDSGNKYFTSVKGVLYNKSKKELYCYPIGKKGKKLVLPKSVKKIQYNAFMDVKYLENIVMGDHVEQIDAEAFYHAVSLKRVTLSEKLTIIKSRTFKNCKSLQKIVIPDRVKKLSPDAFGGCTSMKEVVLGKKLADMHPCAFAKCHNLRKITFKGKDWLKAKRTYSEKKYPFYLAGSKDYKKLTVKLPKCSKAQKKKCRQKLYKLGISKKAKFK